jgi:hypothetical protein
LLSDIAGDLHCVDPGAGQDSVERVGELPSSVFSTGTDPDAENTPG